MGALRKAGVWLGLVEEEDDDRGYDDGYDGRSGGSRSGDAGYRESRYRSSRYSDEFAEDDDEAEDAPAVPRARSTRHTDRHTDRPSRLEAAEAELAEAREARESRAERALERSSVRSITRSPAPESPSQVSYATRDNLALAPQVQLRERAVVADDEQRYQITTLHPTTYREARTIGEHFRDGVPVIINLTEMDESDARRLVDFAAGLAFGLRGTIERVTNRVFLLSPANVQVTAEDKAKIAEGGFFTLP
ncbi:cell division inhibitor SepF [Asanoa hainanensis]|uniref:Cell division protein SepF n=1 Tax=Asanoa hainanensis TaxID=560556 RepID=A0A239NGF9_9ACTN|nr:cell division protein SepF [Asanoa hainanensis]SNT53199.1 cell division inhibitor SepF [Asanoa hainanensis]